jgi:hypothetical protein
MSQKTLPFVFLIALSSLACTTPHKGIATVSSVPGWGRVYSPEEEKTTIRAVPAAATPVVPVTRTGVKPGWGRD